MDSIFSSVFDLARKELNKPLSVVVVGQTGTGKSSLLNSLFNAGFQTSDIAPCTKEVQEVAAFNDKGEKIIFYDMPGIGESTDADSHYLSLYADRLAVADIVLWTVHCDSRSVVFDMASLGKILSTFESNITKAQIIRKLTIVLTKADTLYTPAWIYVIDGDSGYFAPSKQINDIFYRKEEYFQYCFYEPFADLLKTKIDLKEQLLINSNDLDFYYEGSNLFYKGFLSKSRLETLVNRYPSLTPTFNSIYEDFRVITVSAKFRFNLTLLLKLILRKMSGDAAFRFGKYLQDGRLGKMPFKDIKEFGNIIVFDRHTENVLYNLSDFMI